MKIKHMVQITIGLIFIAMVNISNANNLTPQLLKKNIDLNTLQINLNKSKARGFDIFATVGSDVNCDFSSINAAINFGFESLKTTSETFIESIAIINSALTIEGGFQNCLAATSGDTPTGMTVIDGNNLNIVIFIGNDSNEYTVSLSNITIQNGKRGDGDLGGGIDATGSNTRIELHNVRVINNNGSGIAVDNINFLGAEDILIANNSTTNGGGIYCSNTNIIIFEKSEIHTNSAQNGGGVYATNSCKLMMVSGAPYPVTGRSGINLNTASSNGGGIYATNAAKIKLYGHKLDTTPVIGSSNYPVFVEFNTASVDGGAFYVTGASTEVEMSGVNISSNSSDGFGGAAAVIDQAKFVITRYNLPCWNKTKCNQLTNNKAGTNFSVGGAVYALNNASIGLGNVLISDNAADYGSVLYLSNNVTALIEGSIFSNNNVEQDRDGNYLILIDTNTDLTIGFSNFSENNMAAETFSIDNSTIKIAASIITNANNNGIFIKKFGANTETYKCIYTNQPSASFGGNDPDGEILGSASPIFLDVDNGDFHLNHFTSAVDLCGTTEYTPSLNDFDNEPRGWNAPNRTSPYSNDYFYDAGADESYTSDIIFKNSFDI